MISNVTYGRHYPSSRQIYHPNLAPGLVHEPGLRMQSCPLIASWSLDHSGYSNNALGWGGKVLFEHCYQDLLRSFFRGSNHQSVYWCLTLHGFLTCWLKVLAVLLPQTTSNMRR
jgi:hypothetical protein